MVVYWDPVIVTPFQNANARLGNPPSDDFQKENFMVENISVPDFQKHIAGLPEVKRIREYQEHLLAAIRDTSIVGKYSNFHDNCVYRKGYAHPESLRLAHM